MRSSTHQSGFSAVELVIVLAVVSVLGVVGFSVYSRQNTKTADQPTTSTNQTVGANPAKANDVASSPAVTSVSDLDKASATLDQTDLSGSNNTDANQLDSQVANF